MREMWKTIESAPRDTTEIEVKLRDGKTYFAHYACDLTGEDQPSFHGWFVSVYKNDGSFLFYREISEPVFWRPKALAGGEGGE